MGETFGRKKLSVVTGHPIMVQADGEPVWHHIGITVDWADVVALASETTYLDKTVLPAGIKVLRYGQVLVKKASGGKWKPYDGGALVRNEVGILNQTVLEHGILAGLPSNSSDHPPLLDGGACWRARILAVDSDGATYQQETATAAGTISADGNVSVTVTAVNLPGSPKTLAVPVLNGDTAAVVAGKIRLALYADNDIYELFTVGGTGTAIILTARDAANNDATLNIALATGTATGLTAAATSANTTAGATGTAVQTGPPLADLLEAMPLLRLVG